MKLHVVLVPYKRFEMFGRADVQETLQDILFATAEEHVFRILEIEIMKNHVHLFVSIRPSQSISKVVQYLKGASSRYLRQAFPEMKGFSPRQLWSKGKFFRTISEVNEETIRHYITESQGKHKHHKNKTPGKEWLHPDIEWKTQTPQLTLDAFAS